MDTRDEFREFFAKPKVADAMRRNDIQEVYELLGEFMSPGAPTQYLTELLYASGINPLKYLTHIPDLFMYRFFQEPIFLEPGHIIEVIIPNNIVDLGEWSFCYSNINTVIFQPNSKIDTIPDSCFEASTISDIILPDKLFKIGAKAFKDCTQLHEITIPKSIKHILGSAFIYSGVQEIIYEGSQNEWDNFIQNNVSKDEFIPEGCKITIKG